MLSDTASDLERLAPGLLSRPGGVNRKLKPLYLSCGTDDPRHTAQSALANALAAHGIRNVWFSTPGSEWMVARHALADFAPRLFR